jgi:hypothetical protein
MSLISFIRAEMAHDGRAQRRAAVNRFERIPAVRPNCAEKKRSDKQPEEPDLEVESQKRSAPKRYAVKPRSGAL